MSSNGKGEIGFLKEKRRLNVAVTRAKRHCFMVGDSGTVRGDAFLSAVLDYFEEEGAVESGYLIGGEGGGKVGGFDGGVGGRKKNEEKKNGELKRGKGEKAFRRSAPRCEA